MQVRISGADATQEGLDDEDIEGYVGGSCYHKDCKDSPEQPAPARGIARYVFPACCH